MIRFLQTRAHAYTLRDVRRAKGGPRVGWLDYDRLFRARWIGRAGYVFTDLDRLGPADVDLAADLFLQLRRRGFGVWNNPAEVKFRLPMLRALHAAGLNDFNAYSADEFPADMRFPVFLRKTRDHRSPVSDLLPSREALDQAVAAAVAGGVPRAHLMAIEYAGEPVRPGVFRKLSAFRIGDAIVPHISVHDSAWLVKYGRLLENIEDLYVEERDLLRDNPFAEHLMKVFEIAGIEYGRADFGFFDGRIQVYEINTNPHVHAPADHPSPTRVANLRFAWEAYLKAIRVFDTRRGRPVRLADGPVQPGRVRQNWRAQSRPVA